MRRLCPGLCVTPGKGWVSDNRPELPSTVCDFHSCILVTSDPLSTRIVSGLCDFRPSLHKNKFPPILFPLLLPRRINFGTSIWTCRWWCQDLAQLLGQPGQRELDSGSDRQPVGLRASFPQLMLKAYLQSPAPVPWVNSGEPDSLHPQTNPQYIALQYIVDGSGDGDWEGLGQKQKAWLAFTVPPGMVQSRRLKLRMPVRMTLPCLSSLRSVEAIGDKAWLFS